MFPSSSAGSAWGDSALSEMRYLNTCRILELAQQGNAYFYWPILGFFEPFAGCCLRKHLYFPLSAFFSLLVFFFPLILNFSPFPSLSCLFPPLLLFLELPVFPRQL